jgi:hypothetical protein
MALAPCVGWSALLGFWPNDAEDRVLVLWQESTVGGRAELCRAVVAGARPWHRLVAQTVASMPMPQVEPQWLARDWRSAPPDVLDTLVTTVRRWIADSGVEAMAREILLDPLRYSSSLPTGVLEALLDAGDLVAWVPLVQREPGAALARLRAAPRPELLLSPSARESIAQALRQLGGTRDVPTALAWLALPPAETTKAATSPIVVSPGPRDRHVPWPLAPRARARRVRCGERRACGGPGTAARDVAAPAECDHERRTRGPARGRRSAPRRRVARGCGTTARG